VRPELTGTGATPACMAKQASERNRATPAVSAMSLAAVSGPQPKQRWGQPGDPLAELPVQLTDLAAEDLDGGDLGLADHDLHQAAVGGGVLESGGDATQARTGQPAGAVFQVGVELVQVPAQPVDRPGAFGDQVLAMVDQQLDLPGGLVVLGDREGGLA
jgi:hypothetical protein